KLREMSFGQHIREDGPQSHQKKAGTPTMGGLLIVLSIVVPTLLWANLNNRYVWIALVGLIGFGAIGFIDDYAKIRKKKNLGLTARQKLWAQILCAMLIGFFLLLLHANQAYSTAVNIPFFKQYRPDLLIEPLTKHFWTYPLAFVLFYAFIVLVMVGSSNAVNLTDGLDGLAAGLMIIASGAMTALTYVSSNASFSEYLDLAHLPNSQELTIVCASMVGATCGFLWYNCHPAQVFMGDTGSMALGGGLGILAVLIKQEVLLIFIGGIFVIEALSVILQVGSFKLRGGKRIFKMAPIHHHFEALGWPESKVIVRFWIAGLVMALFALTTLKLR
ncbi:MAG TPA: phospho-N-acetylmuramoyl-pentapeptide-transferase, partial [Bryobacteraceae bacterium]